MQPYFSLPKILTTGPLEETGWLATHYIPLILLALCIAATYLIIRLLLQFGQREGESSSDTLIHRLCRSAVKPLLWIGILFAVRFAILLLPIKNPVAILWIRAGFVCGLTIALAAGINILLNAFCKWLIQHETKTQKAQQILLTDLIRRALTAVIWFLTFFFLLQNVFSLNVSALLAGAGVIGLALAFAAQNTVANLFGAVSLIGDTPFKVGDWVKVGDQEGTVEGIGLRSMRLRAFTGELYIIPNRVAADAIITNLTERKFFRQTLNIGLTYSTTPEQMKQAMAILQEILETRSMCNRVRKPIVVFNEMKDWSLNLMVLIWFDTRDLLQKNAELSELNLLILERFNAAGLNFAFPSNTTYLVSQK